jgi:hypothetical protein
MLVCMDGIIVFLGLVVAAGCQAPINDDKHNEHHSLGRLLEFVKGAGQLT